MAAPFSFGFSFDVFLSFGEDTHFRFTGHLCNALSKKKFRTFIDEQEILKRGQTRITRQEAIERSRIFIIVFSEKYPDSQSRLDELVKILDECEKGKGRLVLAVFYHVRPSALRHRLESYGEALAGHKKRMASLVEFDRWVEALNHGGDISGWHIEKSDRTYETTWISSIVKEVSKYCAPPPPGLDSRVEKFESLLNAGSDNEVLMVGIRGDPGIGKTTLASKVYHLNAHKFADSCFLDNVKKISTKHGLVRLQEMFLSKIVGREDIKIQDVEEGCSMIKEMLSKKPKVLVILNNVDRSEQLRFTVGETNWFGPGSIIIITTQNRSLLEEHRVKRIYEMEKLNVTEALDLVCSKASKDGTLAPRYVSIFRRAVDYGFESPLALEIIASHLYGERTVDCNSILDLYGGIPNNEIRKILKVSFDALKKPQQDILIDIARSFEDLELKELEDKLRMRYDDNLTDDIGVLLSRSLIKINEHGQVTLHDLIRDMAMNPG